MSILPLDKKTVKLITTTQIITSVSSVAKELIENALDANAKNVEINLIDNGFTLIEVKDDGCGISKEDAPYMALSSYTSKILTFSDLDSLETYGFRGSALHALSVVSDLTIISRTEQDEAAVSYDIDHNGHIKSSEFCHRTIGTTVQVRQLFKQVPVRRQIIANPKKANQDIKTLELLIKGYGMCKFFVRISYKVDNNIIFTKPSTATLEEAVTYTLGKKVTSNMSWINVESLEINMKLLVPLKESQNVSEVFHSGAQYMFVNNRPIKHKELEKILTKTILEALKQSSSCRKKPIFFLYIITNAANIDINLEPNKTSVFFKEQNIILDTVQKSLENFYGIQKDVQEENVCDSSVNEYQDCTLNINVTNVEDEQPICKKRKLHLEENVAENIEKDVHNHQECNENVNNLNSVSTNHSKDSEKVLNSENGQNYQEKDGDKSEKNINLNIQLPPLNLSDSDSNDSQNFTLRHNTNNATNLANEVRKENTDDSPPLELTPSSETFSQLPVVDLGDDFAWDDCSKPDTSEKENKKQSSNVQSAHKEKSEIKKCVTLKEWSKGHISGLKGGTDVESYNNTKSNEFLSDSTHHKSICDGFLKFSKHVRSQVIEQNPALTAPQVAQVITNLWKKLSSEERGYFRDLAREEKIERDTAKREAKEKHTVNINKNRNRLLKALEKMKFMKPENKGNLVMRTIVPWNVDLKKITEEFYNNSTCKNNAVVIGLLCSDLWIVYKSSQIWILNAVTLKKELHMFDKNTNEDTAESIEQLLKQWFSIKDDLSLLHPIHSLPQNRRT